MKIEVNTKLGKISGNQQEGYQEFLGLRYAEPPIGELRYEPPQLITAYSAPYDATEIGNTPPQAYLEDPPLTIPQGEDCLVVNIFTPKADDQKRPVMVYIHGGGFVISSASRPRFHGGNLAKRGDIVVVAVEYRLGVLGFLKANNIPTNLGMRDQICALQWVQNNIHEFGGDPANVTIFGESAGSLSVSWLMMSPKTDGLFHKAICQSGAVNFNNVGQYADVSDILTLKFFKTLKIKPEEAQKIKTMPLEDLTSAQTEMMKGNLVGRRFFSPFPDGDIFPHDLENAWLNGPARKVPLIIGSNAEELPIFMSGKVPKPMLTLVRGLILKRLKEDTSLSKKQLKQIAEVYKHYYPYPDYPKFTEYDGLLTGGSFWFKSVQQAELHSRVSKVYHYWFNYKSTAMKASPHVFELQFVFGNLGSPDFAPFMRTEGTADEWDLAHRMMDAWINFAKKADPNHPDLPEWHPYDKVTRETMVFAVPCKVELNLREDVRIAWEKSGF